MQTRKKIRIKYQNIFCLCSFLFLVSLVILYSYRFFHYRALANPKSSTKTEVKIDLYHVITSLTGNYYETLKKQEETYYFYGNEVSNYLYYSGNLWRIISLKEDKITLISNIPITSRTLNTTYSNSQIDKWLNEEYYSLLNKDFLMKTSTCINPLENEKDSCSNTYEQYITLPSIYDYEQTGGSNSFMNNGYYMYFSNEGNNYYYMDSFGLIHEENTLLHFGIKPMITIQNKTILKGNGTKESPFQIEEAKTNLKDVSVGSYIRYSGYTWRVLENTNAIKMALQQTITTQEVIGDSYSKNSTIGSYLNGSFYNSLENKEFLLLGLWYTGNYDGEIEKIKEEECISYIGLNQIDDLYIHDVENYVMINTPTLNEFVYVIKEDGFLYKSDIHQEYGIRPVLHIRNDLNLTGEGTKENPYEIVGEESEIK